jgi:hypothetical protein
MKAHEIFHQFSDPNAGEILQYLHQQDRPAYRACLQLVANRRRLRPIFLNRKPLPERHSWMKTELSRSSNNDAAAEVLQTWLLGAHRPMICEFLDALDVPHDGQGLLETLPPEPSPDALRAAMDGLFQNHPALPVTAYLLLFPEMDIADWPGFAKILQDDPRFRSEASTPTAT